MPKNHEQNPRESQRIPPNTHFFERNHLEICLVYNNYIMDILHLLWKVFRNIWLRPTGTHLLPRKTRLCKKSRFKFSSVNIREIYLLSLLIRCRYITNAAFDNMSDDWKTLTSLEKLSLRFKQFVILQVKFFKLIYRCEKLSKFAIFALCNSVETLVSLKDLTLDFAK